MEDPRLSRMYARAFSRDFSARLRRTERWLVARRGTLRTVAVLLTLFGISFGYYAHIKGRFGRLKRELKASGEPVSPPVLLVGGKEPLVLQRAPLSDGSMPELLSATFLPGRGMELLQLTAAIPGRGVVSLIRSPSVEDLSRGEAEKTALPSRSSLQAPWTGPIPGASSNDDTLAAEWRGQSLSLPQTGQLAGEAVSDDGLLRTVATEEIDHDVMPDGGSVRAHFLPGNFNNRWPGSSDVVVSALLSIRALDLKVAVRNTGRTPEPVGIGWLPLLVLPSNSRSSATLRVPSAELEEMRGARATGRLLDVAATPTDFSARSGRQLGSGDLSATYTHLRTGFLDNGPVLELRDPESGVGLRMTALSQGMQAVHVAASSSDPAALQVGFATNYADPFSRVWGARAPEAINVLQPGQQLEWHVRFELVALSSGEGPPL